MIKELFLALNRRYFWALRSILTKTKSVTVKCDRLRLPTKPPLDRAKRGQNLSPLTITLLEAPVNADVRHHAEIAIKDGNGLMDRLLSYSRQKQRNKKAAQEKKSCATPRAVLSLSSPRATVFSRKRLPDTFPTAFLRKYLRRTRTATLFRPFRLNITSWDV